MNSSFASFHSMPGLSSISPLAPSSAKSTALYKTGKPSISVHQAEGGSLVLHTSGWAGVGLVFDGRSEDGFALVKEVLANGSADRDKTISVGDAVSAVDGRTTEGMGYQTIRDTILGPVGSAVVLAVRKAGSRSFQDVVLTRASTEFWALSDANKRMKDQLDALNKKLRDCEALNKRQQSEADTLRAQRAELDQTIEKLRAELAEERAARKRFESEAKENGREKKDLEENMESLLKKLSDTTLNFKTAERLARDMTEKARDLEQRKNNEEQLRRMAEEREAAIKEEVLQQTAARREMEKLLDSKADQFRDYDQQKKNAAALEKAYKELQHQMLGERASAQTHLALTTTTEKKLAFAEDTVRKLREQIAALEKEIDEQKKNVVAQKQMNARLSAEKQETERELDSAARSKASAQSSTESAYQRANSLEKRLRDQDAEIAGIQAAGDVLKAEARKATQALDAANRTAAEQASKASECQAQIEALKRQMESERQVRAAAEQELRAEIDGLMAKEAAASRELKLAVESSSRQMTFEKEEAAESRKREAKSAAAAAEANTKLNAALLLARETKAKEQELEEKVKAMAAAVEEARDGQRKAQLTAAGLQTQLNAVLEELGTKELAVISAKGVVKAAEEELEVQQRRAREAAEDAAAANKKLSDLEKRRAAAANEVEGLKKTIAGLEAELKDAALKVKNSLEWEPKVKALESQMVVMQPDLKRLKAEEAKRLQEVKAVTEKFEALSDEYTSTKIEMKDRFEGEMRNLRNQLFTILEERDYLQKEIERYSALPNPVGVGLTIDEIAITTSKGETSRGFRVSAIKAGLSADLSGVVAVGDELLCVNEYHTQDLQLTDIQKMVAGDRGTHVSFDFRRRPKEGGQPLTFRVMLKRGAWGPQHAVMSPEDLDMLDKGRWPAPGSVSAASVDMGAMVRGSDSKVDKIKAISSSFLARAKASTSQVPEKPAQDDADDEEEGMM